MPRRHELDRSTMHTVLLDLSPKYAEMEMRAGSRIVTEALAAWYDSTATDMYVWTKTWIKENRKDLLPAARKTLTKSLGTVRAKA